MRAVEIALDEPVEMGEPAASHFMIIESACWLFTRWMALRSFGAPFHQRKEKSSVVQCLEDEECGSLKLKQVMSLLEHELDQRNQLKYGRQGPSRLWSVVPVG
ncbi:uncharacterized protein [Asterias amurensis]|uniref:uncharacterized protein n=1 Tax=Asterias amurensis TaxID=7602 RepID=UPI003AB2443A